MSDENKKMPSLASDTLPNQGFAKRSTLYQEFLAEREEILRHKWIESEKQGKHRESWRDARSTKIGH